MKKLLIAGFFLSPFLMVAQNVGIGITTPVYKLQLHNSAAANNFMNITHTGSGITVSDGLVLGINGSDAVVVNMENGDLVLGTNNLTRMTIDNTGNVGIGITNPGAKLDINGSVKLEGLNLFEFGAGVAGKEINAGKVGYNAFGQNALTFVGAGTNSTNRAVYFFAEGGTTFSGPATVASNLNIGGQLQVNGNAGSSGQILTSNGASDPTWTNAALSNTTRFAFSVPTTSESGPWIFSTLYNLNPTDVTVAGATITINRSGLYHIEGYFAVSAVYSTQPPAYLSLGAALVADGISYDIANNVALEPDNFPLVSTWTYRKTMRFANDVYISAPGTVYLSENINFTLNGSVTVSKNIEFKISGYLISD